MKPQYDLKKVTWKKVKRHFKTITAHKLLVMQHCFRIGLYRQGLMHDMSKYMPSEFLMGCMYFDDGKSSPTTGERRDLGCSFAWMHHKGRNRHHFEYWIDYAVNPKDGFIGAKMPKRFVAEMVIDRISASRNYQKENYTCRSAWEYYARAKDVYVMNDETRFLLEYLLKMTAAKGEAYTFSYMRKKLLRHRYRDYHVVNGKLVLD